MLNKYKNLSVVARASLWAFFASLIQKGISILATPIFTRILTTTEFAQYTLYQSWHDIFIIFTSLNVFNYAVLSGLKEYENDKNTFLSSSQILVTGLSVLCFIIYFIINIFFKNITGFPISIMILMFIDILFFSSFNIWAAGQRYEFKYKTMTFLSILIGILGPVAGLIAIHFSPNRGYGRIYGVAIINILVGLFVYIYILAKAKKKFDKKYIKFLLIYCLPLIPHFLSSKILVGFDRIMIGKMCSASAAGIYGLAYSLSTLTILVNDSILKSLTPWTYKVIKEGKGFKSLKKNTNLLIILVAIINLLLILFAPEALKIFAPAEYYEAIYIIPAVSASVYFMFLFNVFANIEYYYNETKYVGIASIGAAVTNIVLNLIFIKLFGFIAAGYTTLVSYILYALCHFIFMKKVCKKRANDYNYYDSKMILIISMIFVMISLLIIPLYKYTIIRYALISAMLCFIFIKRKEITKVIVKNKNIDTTIEQNTLGNEI